MISEFKGDYRFLSNFYFSTVYLDGLVYPTVEHAYQAYKTTDFALRTEIRNAPTPGTAKRLGKAIPKEHFIFQWDSIRLEAMSDLLVQKFYDRELRAALLATGEKELIEGNTWGDTYWGVYRGEGANKLGQLLMVVRQLYRVIDGNGKYEESLRYRLAEPAPNGKRYLECDGEPTRSPTD